jgi:cytochrome c peroxidase
MTGGASPVLLAPMLLALGMAGCAKGGGMTADGAKALFPLELPPGAPMPKVPKDNPLTIASVRLGRALFFDPRLSLDRGLSCASCHRPDHAFSDTVALSRGVNGRTAPRNAPSLANIAYHPSFLWDGAAPSLEQQVLVPLLDTAEMDVTMVSLTALLGEDEDYQAQSMKAYGRPMDAFVITRALANYERTLISGHSRFDKFRYQGDSAALAPQELRGWAIFNGDRAMCSTCHAGFDLSDHSFRNIGTSIGHDSDPGRQHITLHPLDRGKFKVPTLRNIARTAPYMHDGSMRTLEQVVDHFDSGGPADPNKDPLMTPLHLTAQERQDLVAFLRTLNDERPLDHVE